jgi:D-alanyl-D-alanine carboxypeptidase (penicillin-binding protein 5/6)
VQRNRNLLVGNDPRVDGLKTGFIEESGYNIAVSATDGELDLVAVVLGVEAENHTEGGRLRADAAKALIDYGFSQFTRVLLSSPPVEPVRVWEGRVEEITPEGAPDSIIVPSEAVPQLSGKVFQQRETTAPVDAGAVLGRVVYEVAGVEYHTVPLVAGESVAVSGAASRLWDRIVRMITRGR